MLFICHLTFALHILFSSPVYLLHFLYCGCWTSEWIETFRNRGWAGVCPLKIQKLKLSGQTYHWNWTYWSPGCILPQFQHCPRQSPSSNNKELPPCNHTIILFYSSTECSLCYCALTINFLEISKEVGKHSISNRKSVSSRVHKKMLYNLRRLQEI